MRSIWKGTIGFGLVNIPVKMYGATDESNIAFVSLDKNNNARIKYKKVNEATGEKVEEENIVKAYPMGSDYVIVDEADFQKAEPEKMDYLELIQTVDEKEIDPMYYEKPYYLEPEKSGVRAYALLREVLRKNNSVALGPFVYHKKEWIALIKPMDNILVLHRLRFAQEIRETTGLVIPTLEVKTEEIKIASMLINQLKAPFKPEQFKDEYSDKLIKVIEAKAKGKTGTYKQMKVVHTNTEDLMAKLKASMKSPTRKAS